ncbi:PhnA protein [Psychrilyobacter sp.]|uniref:PhnA protein n=1 Tax=Psychrilyobacter sp. TaxID=2586924 RepID=UPI00301B47B0
MARGYDVAKGRKNKVSLFGKTLVRRSKSTCELCGETGQKLNIFEVGKIEVEPDFDRCIHICDTCMNTIDRLKKANENDLRFLNHAIWSEENIVKATAIDLIKQIEGKYSWIDDLLDMVYMDEELVELVEKISKK